MITFVIPTTNRATLSRAILSLIEQTDDNWRAIVVYDGIRGKEFQDQRITTINIKKTGQEGQSGLVRNQGIRLCETEWIGFLDDDDTLDKDYVKLLNNYEEYDFVIWRMIYPDGVIIPKLDDSALTIGNVGISFCYKKKLNVDFDRNRVGEDCDFVKKLSDLTQNYIIANEITYNVRR